MRSNMLIFPNKQIRAEVIARFVRYVGYPGVVCFSCGNASEALKREGLFVVDISPSGGLTANKWWGIEEIARSWPHLLDATSGHLPVPLMMKIAEEYGRRLKDTVGEMEQPIKVPTGSGETIICLSMAFPNVEFVPVYNLGPGTKYDPNAPLNVLVGLINHKNLGVASEA